MNNLTLNKNILLLIALLIIPLGLLLSSTIIGPIPTIVLLLVSVFIIGFVSITLKNELYGLFFMLFLYLIIPYSSTDPILRSTGEYYNFLFYFIIF